MASKYDSYWRSQLPALKRLLLEADRTGEGGPLDVSGVREYGDRGGWHGVVVLAGDGIREGEMAHARSLGNVILRAGLLDLCGDYAFRLTISGDLQLTARRLGGVVKKAPTDLLYPLLGSQQATGKIIEPVQSAATPGPSRKPAGRMGM